MTTTVGIARGEPCPLSVPLSCLTFGMDKEGGGHR